MPVGNITGWQQVFADNFSYDDVPLGSVTGCAQGGTLLTSHCSGLPSSVDAKWWMYPDGWRSTPSTGTYYPSRVVSIQNGLMTYHIHSGALGGSWVHMVAALLPKIPGATGSFGGSVYGRYLIRARIDPVYGYHAAFLLWPDSGRWPGEGEIDWPEADFDSPGISAFMHWRGATSGAQQDAHRVVASLGQWHTYEIDWTTSQCAFYIDGRLVGRSTDPTKIPNSPLHLVLQVGTSLVEGTPANTAASNVQIDWVTAYKPG